MPPPPPRSISLPVLPTGLPAGGGAARAARALLILAAHGRAAALRPRAAPRRRAARRRRRQRRGGRRAARRRRGVAAALRLARDGRRAARQAAARTARRAGRAQASGDGGGATARHPRLAAVVSAGLARLRAGGARLRGVHLYDHRHLGLRPAVLPRPPPLRARDHLLARLRPRRRSGDGCHLLGALGSAHWCGPPPGGSRGSQRSHATAQRAPPTQSGRVPRRP